MTESKTVLLGRQNLGCLILSDQLAVVEQRTKTYLGGNQVRELKDEERKHNENLSGVECGTVWT